MFSWEISSESVHYVGFLKNIFGFVLGIGLFFILLIFAVHYFPLTLIVLFIAYLDGFLTH